MKYGDKVYNQSHYSGRTGMASIGKEVTKTMKVKNAAQKFKTYKRKRTEDLAANKNSEPDLLQRSTKHAQKVPQVACLQTEISFCDSQAVYHENSKNTSKRYSLISIRIKTDLLSILLSQFSKFQGGFPSTFRLIFE